jgi:hypothetical protein
MIKHWSYPVAIGGEALLHFFLPEQGFFVLWAGKATLADGAVRGLLEETEENDGLHGLENGEVSFAAR